MSANDLHDLIQLLQTGTPAQRRMAALKLGMLRSPLVIADLLQAAADEDDGVRSLVASALVQLGTGALPAISAALPDLNAQAQLTLVNALRHMPRTDTHALLTQLTADPAPTVAAAARAALDA